MQSSQWASWTLFWSAWLVLFAGGAERAAPRKHVALLVGIDRYALDSKGRAPPRLSGAVSDVHRMKELLVARFGFAPDDIHLLTDEQATHAAIVAKFHDWLIAQSGPGTEALFWFSGHGSRCEDLSGAAERESEHKDSTLVAFDSRSKPEGKSFDFTDDELHSLLRALCERKARVTVVTDACHSGGATRGGDVLPPRFAEPAAHSPTKEDLKPIWPADVPFLDDDDPKRRVPIHYVHLAACANDESANEHAVDLASGGRVVHGALTFFLADALERMEPGTTYEQLARDVGVRLAASYRGQQVQAEGDDLQRVAFAGSFGPPLPGYDARVKPNSKLVDVNAGRMHLLRDGSVLEIQDLGGKKLGRATVTRTLSTTARAEWDDPPPVVRAAAAVRALEVERGSGATPLAVYVAPGAERDAVAAWLAKLARPQIEVVREPALATPLEVCSAADGRTFELRMRPEGALLESFAPQPGDDGSTKEFELLQARLAREVRFRGLLDLAASSGTIGLSVDLTAPSADEMKKINDEKPENRSTVASGRCAPAQFVVASAAEGGATPGSFTLIDQEGNAVGDIAVFHVRIDPRRKSAAYISILCVSEDRNVESLYPTTLGAKDNRLEPGQELPVTLCVFETKVPGLGRPARDRFLVIATSQPADFSSYVSRPAIAEPPVTRGGSPQLPDVLLDALAPCRTRGAASVATAGEEPFGIATIDVQIVPERAAAAGN